MLTPQQITDTTTAAVKLVQAAQTALSDIIEAIHAHNDEAKGPQLNPAPAQVAQGGLLTALEQLGVHAMVATSALTPPAAPAPAAAPAVAPVATKK